MQSRGLGSLQLFRRRVLRLRASGTGHRLLTAYLLDNCSVVVGVLPQLGYLRFVLHARRGVVDPTSRVCGRTHGRRVEKTRIL